MNYIYICEYMSVAGILQPNITFLKKKKKKSIIIIKKLANVRNFIPKPVESQYKNICALLEHSIVPSQNLQKFSTLTT